MENFYTIDMSIKVIYMLFYKLDISPTVIVFPNVAITFFFTTKGCNNLYKK
jgi:hypothetical protein